MINVSDIFSSLPLKEDVEIISKSVTGEDKWGDNEVTETSETVQGYVQEIEQEERLGLQGELRMAEAKCYLPLTANIEKDDIISYQGKRYIIVGEPFTYRAQIEVWLMREVN